VPQRLNSDGTVPWQSCVREGASHVKILEVPMEIRVYRSLKCLLYIPNLKRDQDL
jgi:hypothetical protein